MLHPVRRGPRGDAGQPDPAPHPPEAAPGPPPRQHRHLGHPPAHDRRPADDLQCRLGLRLQPPQSGRSEAGGREHRARSKGDGRGRAALGEFEYLRYDASKKDWAHLPALPANQIRHHKG